MLEKPAYLLGDFIIEIGLAGSTGLCIKEAVFGQLRESIHILEYTKSATLWIKII